MTSLIEQLIFKMGLQDEKNLLKKTLELVRLLELRSANVQIQISEYGKIMICTDIAADILGIPFDTEQSMKLSSLRKSHYRNYKRMFEKLLDLSKIVGINEICIQLNINEVSKKSEEILDVFKKIVASDNPDIDAAHPQYAAMAVFHACKLLKKKVPKMKLLPFSNLRPSQWQNLELRWENMLAKYYKASMDKPNQRILTEKLSDAVNTLNKSTKFNKNTIEPVEDYDKWKQRMILMAQTKLKEYEESKSWGN